MRPGLPYLIYSRFRTLRAPWTKAVDVVCGYIDEAFKSRLAQPLSKESGGGSLHPQPIVAPHLDELLQLQAQLLSELSQPDEHPTPKAGPVRKALRLAGGKDHYD
ncbi:MAG TPA: hypothetical protein VHK26_14660 [Methyloceanibacter sp.]|jgi:hypothetical protein|nr:hypothetical protein [Methyloceanibacter sp.]